MSYPDTAIFVNTDEYPGSLNPLTALLEVAEVTGPQGRTLLPAGYLRILQGLPADAVNQVMAGNMLEPKVRDRLSKIVRSAIRARAMTDPDGARTTVGAYLPAMFGKNAYYKTLLSTIVAQPEMNADSLKVRNGEAEYYGIRLALPDRKNAPHSLHELEVGILCAYDARHKALYLYDLRPILGTWEAKRPRTITPERISIDNLFSLTGESSRNTPKNDIAEFLTDYPRFWSQKGSFAQRSGMVDLASTSALPLVGKYWLYKQLKHSTEAEANLVFAMFRKLGTITPVVINAMHERPELLLPLAKLSQAVPKEKILRHLEKAHLWVAGAAHYHPMELSHVLSFLAQRAADGETDAILAEALAWGFETEGYALDIARQALGQRFGDVTPLTVEILQRVKERSRAIITGLIRFLDSQPDSSRLTQGLTIFRDGVIAQKALLSIMFSQETDGLAEKLTLPPFFFEKYRPTVAAIPESVPAREAVLELLQMVYIVKQKGITDVANRIRTYWQAEKNQEVVTAGAQTGDTALEQARKASGFRRLLEQNILTPPTSRGWRIIDMGSGSGRRLLGPYLEAIRQATPTTPVEMVVGVDLQDLTDPLPAMTHWQMSYGEAAQRAQVQNLEFDEAESDWSASNDSWTIQEQMLNFSAYNQVLRPGGILRLDSPFIDIPNQGYGEVARRLHEQFPELFPGTIEFAYEGNSDSKKFLLYYYDVLFKLLTDAGFELVNLPQEESKRHDFLQHVINGEVIYRPEQMEDPFVTPIYLMQGKPRLHVIARKVANVRETSNVALRVLLDRFFPLPNSMVVK